jgi:peptidoglycan/LPS O-acetylase OafA/YrhL
MTTLIKKQQPNLPSLTGLRFWAVMFILLNHLLLGYVPRDNVLFQNLLPHAGEIGMDIFFILSGFIIHYNYSASISSFSKHSIYSFIVARIARLYPLYIFLFAVELILVGSQFNKHDVWHSLIFFLTMSQSWFYDLNSAGQTVFFMYPQSSISWSVSTEMLLYFSYPLILKLILKDKFSHFARVIFVLIATILCSLLLSWLNYHKDFLDLGGIKLFGEQASMARSPSYSFAFWLTFVSPYVRIFEFIIGVLVCHLFLSLKNVPISTKESHIMSAMGLLSASFILATFLPNEYSIGWINQSLKVIGYYPFIAFIMFVCTRYQKSLLDQFFSWKFFVQQGEYSYSIYLFHIFIYAYAVHVLESVLPSPLRIGLLWTSVFICAFILYRFIEMPRRKWLKNKLMSYYESFANKKHDE